MPILYHMRALKVLDGWSMSYGSLQGMGSVFFASCRGPHHTTPVSSRPLMDILYHMGPFKAFDVRSKSHACPQGHEWQF